MVINGDLLHSPWMNILFMVLFIGLLSAQCPNAHQFQSAVRSQDLLISIALRRGHDWHFLCLGVKKLLFWISLCLHTCFWHLGLSDVIIHGRWPEVYQNWVVFIDYYCTVTILKQRTKINPNVIQLIFDKFPF